MSIGDIFNKMMLSTVLAANFAASVVSLYRSVVLKEM